jgi:hypothetical protein
MIRQARFLLTLLATFAVPTLSFLPAVPAAPPERGCYKTVENDGVWWLQSPSGKRFFSLGVNVVNIGATKTDYRAAKPEYASFLHYPTTDAWAEVTLKRLRDRHFNTIGSWSHSAFQDGPLPFTVVLSLGESAGAPWGDLFSPKTAQKFDENAKRQILPLRDNPNLLGYFSDNELGWWSDALFLHFIKQPETNLTRQQLIRLLRSHYKDRFAALQRDFNTGSARNFDELGHRGSITLRAGGRGLEAVDEFVQCLAERYYQLAHDSIRRYDEHHLILGDRFATWYPQAVARAAKPYVDVISINTGADWKNGEISTFLLKTLHEITGKPILISEFYMCARENRSGNKNSGAIFPTVRTQRERAAAFRTNLMALAELPYVIGAHWFQYYDEPTYGRPDGEDYNMGLVDIDDRPYEELTAAAASLDIDTIHPRAAEQSNSPNTSPVPPLDSESHVWDEKMGLVRGAEASKPALPFADLYAAWDRKSLYLVLYTADYANRHLYPRMRIPRSDAMEWTVKAGKEAETLHVRFGEGIPPVVEGGSAVAHMRQKSTRFMVVLKLPASLLGTRELPEGGSISLQSSLSSHGGLNRMQWTQVLELEARTRAASTPLGKKAP